MAVLAKVSTLRERLPSVLVDPCLYYCCTAHQALAALRSLCTEGCARTARSTCVGVHNVIREFIWTAATVLFAQVRTGYFDAYCSSIGLSSQWNGGRCTTLCPADFATSSLHILGWDYFYEIIVRLHVLTHAYLYRVIPAHPVFLVGCRNLLLPSAMIRCIVHYYYAMISYVWYV